ncbi:hypothetical protein L6452_12908 [Arctium lappa]|uniref:Uncharacterized protein n=1 Tax=Arctium lappa TaxID=4217 RepID=A0ACB9CGS5_ARCLA|nr:hypothetical protein L6452_12908 [Arctium lappa]
MMRKGGMFHFAEGTYKLLLLFDTLGCIRDGLMSPLTMVILGGIIDDYGCGDLTFSNDMVDKSQSLSLGVISAISGDAQLIQDVMADKLADLRYASVFRIESVPSDMAKKGGMFHFADGIDKLLLLFGTLGCIGDGLMSPLTMVILSGIVNDYGGGNLSFSNDVVNKYALKLLVLATGVGVAAFVEGICWTRTAERQTSRLRMEYLRSVLRQEVGFFDTQVGSSTNFEVISAISGDAELIQDVMAEKIPNCVTQLSALVFSIVVCFILSWRLAAASLPFALLFVVPVLGIKSLLKALGMKMKDVYDIGGGVAEQAISSIRTVYSYVGEQQTIDKFSHALQTSMALGIKQGFTKGLMMGSMGMVFGTWAFVFWFGSYLVAEKGESGGRVFISAICVIMAGVAAMSALPNVFFLLMTTGKNIADAGSMSSDLSKGGGAVRSVLAVLDRKTEIDPNDSGSLTVSGINGHIELMNVHFSYPSRPEQMILQGSIRQNIIYGKEEASEAEIIKAAELANAHEFISSMKDGYETYCGERGVQLSGDGIDKLLLLFGTLGCIGDGLMSPLTMIILGGIIDDYGSGDLSFSNEVVDKYALKLLILAIGVAVSAFIEGICWTRTAERQTSRLRMEYLKSILKQEVGFFDTQVGSSTNFEVISAISGDAQLIQDVMADKIPNCLAHLSALVFSIVVSFILSWRLAVASLPFALLFVVLVLGIGSLLKALGMKMKDAYDIGGGVAEQAISSIRTVYSYVGEQQTIDKFSHALQTSMALGIKQGFTKGLMIGSMGMVFVAWAFVSWVGSYLVTEKGETGGRVFVSAICVIMAGLSAMSKNIADAGSMSSDLSKGGGAIRSVLAVLDRKTEINPDDSKGSIRQNIIYGKEEASEAEIMKAAKLANAHEFISSMKDGYETYCGERGVQLSGGQKQRVALARAILKNPAILLLDEATSALDGASENLVQEALEKMMVGRTCVVVAHRLSTIQKSDSIAVIQNGKVAEQGSHSELLSIGNIGSYYSLIKLQHL